MRQTDFLVIGSGIAGLSFALKAAQKGKVLVLTKVNADETNTKYAQGGIAAVFDPEVDSFEKHIEDTLIAGDGLCDREIVEIVVKEGPDRIRELIQYGAQFDKSDSGEYDLTREGGHSENRILHYKDITGWEIERALLSEVEKNENIEILSHYYAVELITQHHLGQVVTRESNDITCYGIYALNAHSGKVEKILSKMTLMATGGAGHIYSSTTNPVIATGDGIAMVYRAKGKVRDMEMIQFHPTSLYNPGSFPSFLVTEAVRGEGGVLRDIHGREFMYDYDERGSLAPRDIVARSIDAEMKKSGEEYVYLDITHQPKELILHHFPTIYKKCMTLGIDMTKDYIPVTPAAHYLCGGILVDQLGQSSIQHLFACGECSSTGLHGANRLASNSLLEAAVFGNRIAQTALEHIEHVEINLKVPDWDEFGAVQINEEVLVTHNLRELQKMMSDYVGIVRSDFRLARANRRLQMLKEETEEFYKKSKLSVKLCELRNLIQCAEMVIKCAMLRKESRGLHYTTDYPYKLGGKPMHSII
ncbi:L-aspartate oxidase [Marinilongibacter aquaticus]|uniref:L-aspartate oxidase n=1 Tax=Marinilongibacter aquaticus TaxID=2975157 RepID=UPI0021BD0D2F|nr:L-aspartate oxidase [Marinilongibacter aquaticus]UBM60649.1 L-aspartate oxidase [Marinilongibacter aquaticus]